MRVTIPEFAGFEPDKELTKGAYTVTINKANIEKNQKSGKTSMLMEYLIQSGPEQPSGNPDPTGRTCSEFLPMSHYRDMSDKGKFCLTKLANLCDAAEVTREEDGSFDNDELLQATIIIHGIEKADNNGMIKFNIVNYSKAV